MDVSRDVGGEGKHGLQCMYTNLDAFNNKRAEFEARIRQLEPDIVGVTEVNSKSTLWHLQQQDLQLSRYNMLCNLKGRGVAVYVKDSIGVSEVNYPDNESSIWCTVNLRNNDVLLIGVVYRSPSSSDEQNSQLIRMITDMIQKT